MKKILIVTLFLAASQVLPRSHAQTNELDHKTVLEHTKTKAEQGDAQAQALLGACYANGQGVARNPVEAVKWFRKAAGQNLAKAQFNLAVSYYLGQGVTKGVVISCDPGGCIRRWGVVWRTAAISLQFWSTTIGKGDAPLFMQGCRWGFCRVIRQSASVHRHTAAAEHSR